MMMQGQHQDLKAQQLLQLQSKQLPQRMQSLPQQQQHVRMQPLKQQRVPAAMHQAVASRCHLTAVQCMCIMKSTVRSVRALV
jgi:hypothetical protein